MGYQALLVDRADGIATVTMNRPEARNALDLTMREEMLGALDEIERDSAVRVMLLTGAGGHFSAGGDVKSMQKKHTAAEGRMPSEGWYDLSTPLWEHFQQNRLTAYDRLARPQASGIRMFLNGGSQLAPWAEACRKGDDDACELFEERLTSARALARTFLVRIASAFCNDIVPHRADVTFVALRMRERTSVPWSLRYTGERTERLLDLGVHPIDRGVVAPGLYVGKAR